MRGSEIISKACMRLGGIATQSHTRNVSFVVNNVTDKQMVLDSSGEKRMIQILWKKWRLVGVANYST
jgi:hypothetical protein